MTWKEFLKSNKIKTIFFMLFLVIFLSGCINQKIDAKKLLTSSYNKYSSLKTIQGLGFSNFSYTFNNTFEESIAPPPITSQYSTYSIKHNILENKIREDFKDIQPDGIAFCIMNETDNYYFYQNGSVSKWGHFYIPLLETLKEIIPKAKHIKYLGTETFSKELTHKIFFNSKKSLFSFEILNNDLEQDEKDVDVIVWISEKNQIPTRVKIIYKLEIGDIIGDTGYLRYTINKALSNDDFEK